MYKIKLADGTTIDNLELNGNNYIPQTPVDVDIFKGNLETITIINGDGDVEKLNDCRVAFAEVEGKQSFIIREKTKEEIEKENFEQLLADLTELVLIGGAM